MQNTLDTETSDKVAAWGLDIFDKQTPQVLQTVHKGVIDRKAITLWFLPVSRLNNEKRPCLISSGPLLTNTVSQNVFDVFIVPDSLIQCNLDRTYKRCGASVTS